MCSHYSLRVTKSIGCCHSSLFFFFFFFFFRRDSSPLFVLMTFADGQFQRPVGGETESTVVGWSFGGEKKLWTWIVKTVEDDFIRTNNNHRFNTVGRRPKDVVVVRRKAPPVLQRRHESLRKSIVSSIDVRFSDKTWQILLLLRLGEMNTLLLYSLSSYISAPIDSKKKKKEKKWEKEDDDPWLQETLRV